MPPELSGSPPIPSIPPTPNNARGVNPDRSYTSSRLPSYRHSDVGRVISISPEHEHFGATISTFAPAHATEDVLCRRIGHIHAFATATAAEEPESTNSFVAAAAAPPPPAAPALRDLKGKGNEQQLLQLQPQPTPQPLPTLNNPPTSRRHSVSAAGRTRKYPPLSSPNLLNHYREFETAAAVEAEVASQKATRNVLAASPANARMLALANTKTSQWISEQSNLETVKSPSATSPSQPRLPRSVADSNPSRPLILPIRGFKPSKRMSQDDNTLSALQGLHSQRSSQDEQNSDDSDLFLKVAKEEESRQNNNGFSRSDNRRSRIAQRQSLPPSNTTSFNPSSTTRRRGSDQESQSGTHVVEQPEDPAQALNYHPPSQDRAPTALNDNRNRFQGAVSRSALTAPRVMAPQEVSLESRQRSLGPESPLPPRTSSYRQSNLSHSTPRTYSSPLASRTVDNPVPEATLAAESTESTVSTTAPSTVWDELDDLKSRIHRLELTGKLPTTSGAAISRASNERPTTATTTVTTVSSSPKRGRGNSISPIESSGAEPQRAETHPLLHSALAKSKASIHPEIYKALEATAFDALAIAAMMGTTGQPGPISSSQSSIGGGTVVSDRQLRRKADSMCRSLTELSLALSERSSEQILEGSQISTKVKTREPELQQSIEQDGSPRQPVMSDLARVKESPRALSRLEQRRSSLLATSSLPSPRFAPSAESSTPTSGRRTSMFLRSRRAGTEELEEDEVRFRAPSRATTEISRLRDGAADNGRLRNSPREYPSQTPLLDQRSPALQSSLPVRRQYNLSSLTNTTTAPTSNIGSRRFIDRSTPERDTTSVAGRLAEERVQRKSSIGGGFGLGRSGSLNKRIRQPSNMESSSSTAGQNSTYQ